MDSEEQLERTLQYASIRGPRYLEAVARVRANRRLWRAGDLFLVAFGNGACRWPLWGVSSRGYKIAGYFAGICPHNVFGSMAGRHEADVVEVPDGLAHLSPIHPVFRQFIVGIARDPLTAFRVDASSPDSSKGSP